SEARNPLKTIPRAVIQSALLAGAIFIVCAYTEVLGLRTAGQDLGASQAPMRVLAGVGGVPVLGLLIDIGVLVSMFAGTLACITAAARVLLLMAHNGLTHRSLPWLLWRRAAPADWTFMVGWVHWPPTDSLWLMLWSALRFRVTCANTGRIVPGRRSSRGSRSRPCCWRSSAISIRFPKHLTGSCLTFIWPTCARDCSGFSCRGAA